MLSAREMRDLCASSALSILLVACGDRDTEVRRPADASFDVVLVDPAEAGAHAHGATCDTIGRTGATDACLLFAYCGHRQFELDCSARFTCSCSEVGIDGGPTKTVVADPIYCESDPADLRGAFDRARSACGW